MKSWARFSRAGSVLFVVAASGCLAGLGGEARREAGFSDPGPETAERYYRIPIRKRDLEFVYRAEAMPPESAQTATLFVPMAHSGDFQQVRMIGASVKISGIATRIDGPDVQVLEESRFGNRALRVTSRGEPISVEMRYRVSRSEHLAKDFRARGTRSLRDPERERFGTYLGASRMVPIDGLIAQRAARAIGDQTNLLRQARLVYDDILSDMRYDKSMPGWGRGDALWACDSRFGNCTDFHSLFIGTMRSLGIPAKFMMGFPIPPERGEGRVGGYHCWAAFFLPDYGWVPVDISEADRHPELAEYYFGGWTENRVEFTVGRDLLLPGQQDPAPLNFFIYPYFEVDGKRFDKGVVKEFFYQDIE